MYKDLKETLDSIVKISSSMRDEKDMSAKHKCQADRILGLAEKQLTAMSEAGKPAEGGE